MSNPLKNILQATSTRARAIQDVINRDDAVHGEFVFRSFKVTVDKGGRKTTERTLVAPPREKLTSRDGKSYNAPLKLIVQLVSLDPVPGAVRETKDGSWEIFSEVRYRDEAMEWLRKQAKDAHEGRLGPEVTFPVTEYVSADGNVVTHRWCPLAPRQIVTVKASDQGGTLLRKRTAEGPVVGPGTVLRGDKVVGEVFVALRDVGNASNEEEEEDDTTDAAAGTFKQVPRAYLTLNAKAGVSLSTNDDPSLPESERLHRDECKDTHPFVPIEPGASTLVGAARNPYLYIESQGDGCYNSPPDAERRISRAIRAIDDPARDLVYTYNEEISLRRAWRFLHMQITAPAGVSVENAIEKGQYERYEVHVRGREDAARAYGILDPETYKGLMLAHPAINTHIYASLWVGSTLKHEGNRPDVRAREEYPCSGYYTLGADHVVPDYARYLPTLGIPLSRERVESEFEEWQKTTKKTGRTSLDLVGPYDNPLHARGAGSQVINLGHGQEAVDGRADGWGHMFRGDVWPLLGRSRCYALTSASLAEKQLRELKTEAAGDALLDTLIDTQGVLYQIFLLQDLSQPLAGSDEAAATKGTPSRARSRKPKGKTQKKR